jgi:hypothetical protein
MSQPHVTYTNDTECTSANDHCEQMCKKIRKKCFKECLCPEGCLVQDGKCSEDCQACTENCAETCMQKYKKKCCPETDHSCADECTIECTDICNTTKKTCPYATKSITWETAEKSSTLKLTVKKTDNAKEEGWNRIKEIVQATLPLEEEDGKTYSMTITKGGMNTQEWIDTLNYVKDLGMEVIEKLEQDDVATGGIISIELIEDNAENLEEMTEESITA